METNLPTLSAGVYVNLLEGKIILMKEPIFRTLYGYIMLYTCITILDWAMHWDYRRSFSWGTTYLDGNIYSYIRVYI